MQTPQVEIAKRNSKVRVITAVLAALGFVGCFVYVVGPQGFTPPQDLVKEGNIVGSLTHQEIREARKIGRSATEAPLRADPVIDPQSGDDGSFATSHTKYPTPSGELQKSCMQCKVFFYAVRDQYLDIVDNQEVMQALGAAIPKLVEYLAPSGTSIKDTSVDDMTPAQCEIQARGWKNEMDNTDLVEEGMATAIWDALKQGKLCAYDSDEKKYTIGAAEMGLSDDFAFVKQNLAASEMNMQDTAREMKTTFEDYKNKAPPAPPSSQGLSETQEQDYHSWDGH